MYCAHEVFLLLLRPVGAQNALTLAQKCVLVILSDVVEISDKRWHCFVQLIVHFVLLSQLLLPVRLLDVKLLREVLLEVLGEQIFLVLLAELYLHRLQLEAVVSVFVKEALKERVELLPTNLTHLPLRQTVLVDVCVRPMLSYQLQNSQPLRLLIWAPLVLALEGPLGLSVRLVVPPALSLDDMTNGANGKAVFGRRILTGIDSDRADLLEGLVARAANAGKPARPVQCLIGIDLLAAELGW